MRGLFFTSPALRERSWSAATRVRVVRAARPSPGASRRPWSALRGPSPHTGEEYLGRFASGDLGSAQRRPDRFYDLVRGEMDLIVPEPQHAPALRLQPRRPSRVICRARLRMLPAVKFNDQPLRDTGEIDDERPDGILAPKFASRQPPPAQQEPQPILALGHTPPKRARMVVRHRATLAAAGKQTIAPRTPRPLAGLGRDERTKVGAKRRVRALLPAPPSPASQELRDLSRKRGRGAVMGMHP